MCHAARVLTNPDRNLFPPAHCPPTSPVTEARPGLRLSGALATACHRLGNDLHSDGSSGWLFSATKRHLLPIQPKFELMSDGPEQSRSLWPGRLGAFACAVVFLSSLLITGLVLGYYRSNADAVTASDLDHRSDAIAGLIKEGFNQYANALGAERMAILAADDRISPTAFQQISDELHIQQTYPGMNGLAWLPARSDPGETAPLLATSPFDQANVASLTPDIESARATGQLTMVGALTDPAAAPSTDFTLLLPVYKPGMPVTTESQREKAFLGTAATTINADAMVNYFARNVQTMTIQLHDGAGTASPAVAAFAPRGSNLTPDAAQRISALTIGGRTVTIQFSALPTQATDTVQLATWVILLAGLALSVLLTVGVWIISFQMRRSRRYAREMARLATRDELTGLANRAGINACLAAIHSNLESGEIASAGAIYVDLNSFKTINDSYGHSHGDDVLIECAQRLRVEATAHGVVGRLGGDEFVVLVNDVSAGRLQQIAESLREALTFPYPVSDYLIVVTASVGAAIANNSSDAATLINRADLAMYKAKHHPNRLTRSSPSER